jgi:transposase
MLHSDVAATMRSVAELIETVADLQARKVCYLIADLLRRALEENECLRAQIAAQADEIAQLRAENAQLRAENAQLRAENAILKEQNAWLRRQLFGDKGEKIPPAERDKPEAGVSKAPPTVIDAAKLAEAKELQKKARAMMREAHAKTKKPALAAGKARITSELVRRRVPDGIICGTCNGEVKDKGMAHTASELDVVPATFIRREYLLHRGECACGAVSFVMPGPERGIEKTTASANLIAECAVDKFLYHFPVHRQEAWLKEHGVDLAKSTVNGWLLRGAATLEPLWKRACAENRKEPVKQCDESPVCVVTGGESKDRFLWCVLTTKAVSFDITETRNQAVASEILGKDGEATMTDGHGVYNKKTVPGKHAQCMAHGRRKYFDALVSFPKEAFAFLTAIHALFMVEREADEAKLDADGRLALRKKKSVALVNELATLLQSFNPPPRSSLGRAIKYMTKRWTALTRFLTDGRIPLSNNGVETRFRDAKLGFKNFLFAQSEVGADAVAIYYTLIASARLHGLDPVAYIADCLRCITGGHPASRLGELLPWNWTPPDVATDEDELPPMSREETISSERVVAMRRLSGKVHLASSPPGEAPKPIQNTAVN